VYQLDNNCKHNKRHNSSSLVAQRQKYGHHLQQCAKDFYILNVLKVPQNGSPEYDVCSTAKGKHTCYKNISVAEDVKGENNCCRPVTKEFSGILNPVYKCNRLKPYLIYGN
jgi:hypothetical protein